jgi:two-component system alkaline phosphatase synthesis response regulator PhoP
MPKVLVVADTPWVTNDVHAALGLPGFEMQDHSDPRTLTDAVSSFEPDLAIIDLQVAAMGGMAMARALKESAYSTASEELPVILLLDRSADAFLAKRAAADRWLLKPFTAADLRAAVGAVWTEEPATRT